MSDTGLVLPPTYAQTDDGEMQSPQETKLSMAGEVEARMNRRGLLANLVLLVGYALALWFQVYEYNSRDRETVAIVVYLVAFALLILSAMMELSIDVFSVRRVGHGRYHAGSALWNSVISSLFIFAGTLDIIAFVYWLEREKTTEITVLLVSSYVLLVMAILVFNFQVSEAKQQLQAPDIIDLMANILVLFATVVGVVLRHMEYSQKEEFGDATDNMELGAVPLWLVSSVMYVATDAMGAAGIPPTQ